ncbi:MAG: T9SS type A sorting domain-containing protein [Saprospiraceae bacterium]
MKKIYLIFGLAIAISANLMAQTNPAISACKLNNAGGFRLIYNDNKSCKSQLKTFAKLGFHSGVTIGAAKWQNVVPADKDGYIPGIAKGAGIFWVDVPNPKSYYSVTTLPTEISCVFNQHAVDATTPWGNEGKGKGVADPTACEDFFVTISGLASCTSRIEDELLDISTSLAPNPMQDFAILTINGGKESYKVDITSVSGQIVRQYTNVSETLVIEKNELTKGLYFIVIKNNDNKFHTQKLIIE